MVSIDNILRVRKSGRLLSQEAGELMRMNIPKNGTTISTLTAFFLLLVMPLFFAASESAALDNPHVPNNTVNCATCHITNPPAGWWTDQGQAGGLCGQCHNAAAAMGTDVTTHVSTKYGNVILQCTDCHNPHYQRQFRLFKDPSYLYQGRISAVTSTTMTQDLTYTGAASWTDNQWAGMLLVPDVRYPGYNYRILSNTGTMITIDTGATGADAINLTYAKPGATFAIVYGKLVKESVWGKVVRFFRKTGANSFADGDATVDGICQVCHTQTIAFNSSGTLEDPTNKHPKNVAGTDCKSCHTHTNNFKAACNACHGYPPIDATAGGPSGLADNNGATAGGTTGSTTPGAHARHVTTEGISCASCHVNSAGLGATHNNGDLNVTLGFYLFNGAVQGGSYNGQTTVNYNATATTPATTTSKLGGLTCGTVYCHSTVQGLGGTGAPTYKTPSWTNALPNNVICGSCHNDNTETAGAAHTGVIMSSGTHTKHVSSSGYSMPCSSCHSVAGSGTSSHVNYTINVAIEANYGGTYGGDTANTGTHTPGQGYGTCSTTYCHSTGTATPAYTAPVWGGTVVCGDCHGADATTPPSSSSHAKHVGSSSVYKFNCKKCHSTTVDSTAADSTTKPGIVDKSVHVMNKTRDVNLNTSDPLVGSLATNSGTDCTNIYCHSTGKAADVPTVQLPAAYSGTHYSTVTWGATTITCASCHGKTATVAGMPDYTSVGTGQATSNSHSKHVNQASDCGICHTDTTTTGTAIKAASTLHINQIRNVNFAASFDQNAGTNSDNYSTLNKTCSSISCHGPGTPQWGGASQTCSSCHVGTGDLNDYTWNNYAGTAARIDSTQWGYSGHGKTTGSYDVTLNPAANLPAAAGAGDPCLYCHDGTGVAHGDATNVFRLRNFADATFGKNGACMKCHGTGQAGVDPDGSGTVYATKTATKKVDKYHFGTQHSDPLGLNGGLFCWDCHDPHGDSTGAAGPIAMVQLNPAQASNATTGAPTTATSNAVTFTARSAASDYGSNVATKICNVCHTYKAADPNKMVHYYNTTPFTDNHNSGTVCTQCHKHGADTTYNGDAFKGVGCNGCHDYDTRIGISWGTGFTAQAVEGFGAHQKHIDHIKARFTVTLNPNTDTFGAGAAAAVCGTCHTNAGANHTTGGGTRLIDFGGGTYKEGGAAGFSFVFGASNPAYSGVTGSSSSVNPKSCSNISCHFQTTPVWSAY